MTKISPVRHDDSFQFRVWRPSGGVMAQPHTHPGVEINLLCRGGLSYFLAGRFVDLTPGQILIFWGGMPHQTLAKSNDADGIWLTLPITWLLGWKHTAKLAEHLLKGGVIQRDFDEKEKSLFSGWKDDMLSGSNSLRDIILLELEGHLSRISVTLPKTPRKPGKRTSGGTSRIDTILAYVTSHYQDEIGVEDIARAMRLHPKYLITLFRKACQMSLYEYIQRLRLGHAQRLLLTSDRTVADIAFDSGFSSLSSFYRTFRLHVPAGTPAAYRADTKD